MFLVVLSNSKDGATAAMICYWQGTNKDRKTIMKTIKEHIIDMCKHEHAHTTIIALLDATDDTVALNKILLGTIVSSANDLVSHEWGRRVLLWLVAPGNSAHFHPGFVKELENGREGSSCKKDLSVRRSEILENCISKLLNCILSDTKLWLSNGSIGVVTFAILKAGKFNLILFYPYS